MLTDWLGICSMLFRLLCLGGFHFSWSFRLPLNSKHQTSLDKIFIHSHESMDLMICCPWPNFVLKFRDVCNCIVVPKAYILPCHIRSITIRLPCSSQGARTTVCKPQIAQPHYYPRFKKFFLYKLVQKRHYSQKYEEHISLATAAVLAIPLWLSRQALLHYPSFGFAHWRATVQRLPVNPVNVRV